MLLLKTKDKRGGMEPEAPVAMAAMLQSPTFPSWTMDLLLVCAEATQMHTVTGPSKEQPRSQWLLWSFPDPPRSRKHPQKLKESAKPRPITQQQLGRS